MTILKAALIQTNARREVDENLVLLEPMVREAAAAGARLIVTPENVAMLEPARDQAVAKARPEAEHPAIPAFARLAEETGAWLLAGSLAICRPDGRLNNRSYLFGPDGAIRASYSKIHLFDVELANGESYRESATYAPGQDAVLADSEWGPIGLTVCYDLRFPHLFRDLARAGARVITVPSAFTVPTGEAHWHVLLRARAIETGAFILAPAQTGVHAEGRRTYGHSLAVAPWGEVLADGGTEPGVTLVDLDLAEVDRVRQRIPALHHDRRYASPGDRPGSR